MSPQGGQTEGATPTPIQWINARTGAVVSNPGQVGIVRGEIVRADSDKGKAALEARRARIGRAGDAGRAAQREMRADELNASREPKDNGAKIRALMSGTVDAADLYRTAEGGPSGQRRSTHVGRVRYTPSATHGEFTVTDRDGGATAGYLTSAVRNGEQRYAVYRENPDGGVELQGWTGTVSHGADILVNGEAQASSLGRLDARRISGSPFERNPNRGKTTAELDQAALNDEIRRTREALANPGLTPSLRASREARLAELEAERRGDSPEALRRLAAAQQAYMRAQESGDRDDHEAYEALVQQYADETGTPLREAFQRVEEGPMAPGAVMTLDMPRDKADSGGASNSPTTEASMDSISRHASAPVSVTIFPNGAGQARIGDTTYDLHRQDGKWYADPIDGDGSSLDAADMPTLARKMADAHGVTGRISIQDERSKGKSLTQAFDHTAKAPKAAPAAPSEPILGVTETAKGRTTTVTLPDGTTAQRTSKTMAYTHAVVATTDNRAEASSKRAEADRLDEYVAAFEAWKAAGADKSKLKAYPSASLSFADQEARKSRTEYFLPGFEPKREELRNTRYNRGGHWWSGTHFRVIDNDGDVSDERDLDHHRSKAARLRQEAADLDAGPAESFAVLRWSQSYPNAAKGQDEFDKLRNTRLQIVGVGGEAKPTPADRAPDTRTPERPATDMGNVDTPARPVIQWRTNNTGFARPNPSQVDIVRGDVVLTDPDELAARLRRAAADGGPDAAKAVLADYKGGPLRAILKDLYSRSDSPLGAPSVTGLSVEELRRRVFELLYGREADGDAISRAGRR